MKKFNPALLFLLLAAFLEQGNAQITNVTSIPFPATNNDEVKILLTYQWNADIISHSNSLTHAAAENGFVLTEYVCEGPLAVNGTTTDTISLGLLYPGTYSVDSYIGYASKATQCGVFNELIHYPAPYVFEVYIPTAIADAAAGSRILTIYPNPTRGELTIHCVSDINVHAATAKVTNAQGELATAVSLVWTGSDAVMNMSSMSAGVYFIQLETENGMEVRKFVKE